MKCPNCKFENDENNKKNILCAKCGHPINLSDKWNPSVKTILLILLAIYGLFTILYFIFNAI